jgi:hypothetical protein
MITQIARMLRGMVEVIRLGVPAGWQAGGERGVDDPQLDCR